MRVKFFMGVAYGVFVSSVGVLALVAFGVIPMDLTDGLRFAVGILLVLMVLLLCGMP